MALLLACGADASEALVAALRNTPHETAELAARTLDAMCASDSGEFRRVSCKAQLMNLLGSPRGER